jgi:hypothetical protein
MPFTYKHDFFVSYPHMPPDNIVPDFVNELVKAIRYLRTGDQIPEPVYVDKERLRPGFRWKPELARALCHSRAMLAVYTSDYFSREYCAREWDMMAELETKRLGKSTHSMIIPILFRVPKNKSGKYDLPDPMTDLQYEDFNSILRPRQQFKTVGTTRQVDKIISRINDLRRLSSDPRMDCNTQSFSTKTPTLFSPTDPYVKWGS